MVPVLVPGQGADPGLDVVVQLELDAARLGDPGGGVGDLVLGALVLDGELASVARSGGGGLCQPYRLLLISSRACALET